MPLEHQCNLARFMPWRAHVYLGDLWRGHIKDHPGRPYTLPFVLPILILQHPARNTEQLDILLARNSPDPDTQTTGLDDVRALWKYLIEVFGERSRLRTLLLKVVNQPVREEFMTMKEAWLARGEKKGLAKGQKEGQKEGLAKGLATAVLDLLELRAVTVPPRVRKRVLATRDEPLLRRWHARALTVLSAEALFEPLEA